MPSEAQARITINKLLEEAGWRFYPDAQGRLANIICEHRVTGQAFPRPGLGSGLRASTAGFRGLRPSEHGPAPCSRRRS